MFWDRFIPKKEQTQPEVILASCLGSNSYTLAAVKNNQQVLFSLKREFDEKTLPTMGKSLAEDVERLELFAHACDFILLPGEYQLIMMDAPDVPEAEMAKALRWSLKGLSDYDLKDVAVDAFLVPSSTGDENKQAIVAITPLSILKNRRTMFESAFLEVTSVSIAEMALKNLMGLINLRTGIQSDTPIMIISLSNRARTLHIMYQNMYYLIRELSMSGNENPDEPDEWADISFELERSIDYCVNQLNLPQPKELLLTPGFHRVENLFPAVEEALGLKITLIDLNQFLQIDPPLSMDEQSGVFFSIAGALRFNEEEQPS